MTVKQLICSSILPLGKTDTAELALGWMDEFRVSHLPLVDGNEYLGLIGDAEILDFEGQNVRMSELCKGLAKPYILDEEHYFNALHILAGQNLSVLPVLDVKHTYTGVITREKIFNEMAESLSVHNPGGIIVLELNQNDYTLSEISRIVESNDAKILSLNIRPAPGSTKLEITLKVNHINIEAIIRSFERFNYEIKTYFGENQKDDDLLLERYESLLTYLKY
jgi:predicted transcriptional regulator